MVAQVLSVFQFVNEVVVERTVGNKFQGTDGVGDSFKVVALSMSEVIHGVSLPFVARAVMTAVDDAINHRVAEVHIGVGHINLGAKHHAALGHLAAVHLLEQGQALFDGTVAIGTFCSGLSRRTFLGGHFFAGLFVDIGFTFLDKFHGKFPKLFKVVGSIIYCAPFKAQPFDIFHNGVDVFRIFLLGVGVVEAEVAYSSIFLCDSEVHANSFSMSDVQVSVRLRREAGLQTAIV